MMIPRTQAHVRNALAESVAYARRVNQVHRAIEAAIVARDPDAAARGHAHPFSRRRGEKGAWCANWHR